VLGHRGPQVRKTIGEADEAVELGLLLLGAEVRVVEILPAAGGIETGRLQLGGAAGRDPDIAPRRRNGEGFDPLDHRRIGDPIPARVAVPERLAPSRPGPSSTARHGGCLSESEAN
jgi:hypothetical protein